MFLSKENDWIATNASRRPDLKDWFYESNGLFDFGNGSTTGRVDITLFLTEYRSMVLLGLKE